MLNKRWRLPFLVGVFIAILALVAVACGGDEEEEEAASPTAAAGATEEPGGAAPPDQQVLVAQSAEPEFFDPHRSNFEQDIAIERMLFRGLYQLAATEDGGVEAVPAMAADDPEVNGNIYTIKLRSGLKWSDGEAMTAQHFVDGIARGCDPAVASPYAYLLQSPAEGGIIGVKGCDELLGALGTEDEPKSPTPEELQALREGIGARAVDDETLEIELVGPKPLTTFKDIFSLWVTFPARLDVIDQFGEKWTDPGNIVGNGPFVLTGFIPKDSVTLEPNPNWALEPKPQLQELTIKFIDDFEVAFRAYQTGELDMTRIPAAELPTVEADPQLTSEFLKVGSGRIWAVELQMENEVLKDFNVRLALSRAIDRETLVDVVYSGAHIPATYWLVEGIPGYQGNEPFESTIGYDPEAAKQALADAGYPDGQGFPTLKITVTDSAERRAEGEFLQRAWKETLGIDITIEAVDARTRSQTFNSENFELFPGGWQIDYPDPENPLIGLFDTGGGNNHYNCSDPDIDAKLAAAGTETDDTARIKLLQEAETLVVTKLCGAIPIYQTALLYTVKPKVGGVNANGSTDAAMPGNWCPECWFIEAE